MAAPLESNKIKIYRTVGEIEFIKHQLKIDKDEKRKDIRSYLRSEIKKLVDAYNKCPDCVTPAYGVRKEIAYYMEDVKQYQTLQQISFLVQKSVSALIDDYFIAPLLAPDLK